MDILEKIAFLIRRNDTSQRKVEAALGLSNNRISKWNMGQGKPHWDDVWQLCQYFKVSPDYLLDERLTHPDQVHGLTEDERAILQTVRDLRLPREEVNRRLFFGGQAARQEQPEIRTSGGGPPRPKGRRRA